MNKCTIFKMLENPYGYFLGQEKESDNVAIMCPPPLFAEIKSEIMRETEDLTMPFSKIARKHLLLDQAEALESSEILYIEFFSKETLPFQRGFTIYSLIDSSTVLLDDVTYEFIYLARQLKSLDIYDYEKLYKKVTEENEEV